MVILLLEKLQRINVKNIVNIQMINNNQHKKTTLGYTMDKMLKKIDKEIPKKAKTAHKDMKMAIAKDKKRDPDCKAGAMMKKKSK